MYESHRIGKLGEDLAVDFLLSKGFRILVRNWRFRHKEIDIIAFDSDNILRIVEVKCRSEHHLIDPIQSVDLKKQRFLISAANAFALRYKIDAEISFDIVSIVIGQNKQPIIEFYPSAFYPILK